MTITVSCPACGASFPVDPAKVPPGGVRAQCSLCPEIFDVDEPDEAVAEVGGAPPVAEVVQEEAPTATAPKPAPSPGPIQFGKRTPEDKARSLARSLVFDLITYNPDKHTEALAAGTLVEVFSDEIGKSWKEYQAQIDPDVMAQGTFFDDALNELLANGESVFNVEG